MGFVSFLKDWEGLIGACIGGIIGGLFTYLGVMLTFKQEVKNEHPKKLYTLSEMIFLLEDYEDYLKRRYFDIIGLNDIPIELEKVDLKRLKENLLLKAVNVDKATYRIIIDNFSKYRKRKYEDVIINNPQYQNLAFDAVEGLQKEIPVLKALLRIRIAFYEKKIK